ncbi:hypothetical protein AB0467_28475 [Streptomyces sp. NPDC052095]|uniref:hypothetical protein n=1 Tax=unclassified Streptomyces TaxID=2593676 RepID=UPI00344BA6E1
MTSMTGPNSAFTGTRTAHAHTPRAGWYEDREEDDNQRGFERDETDTDFHRLVQHLVAGGDDQARKAGRRTRRTLAEMAPGYVRQPVLVLHRPVMANDSCPLCHRWQCDPSNCPPSFAPASTHPAPVGTVMTA